MAVESQAKAESQQRCSSDEGGLGPWTRAEHDRFLAASKLYPFGPWKMIAAHVKTRNVRQTQTHAQKYKEKLARWDRGLCRRRKISFDSEDGLRPKFIDRPLSKKAKKKKASEKTRKGLTKKAASKKAAPVVATPAVAAISLAELEPLALPTDFKLVPMDLMAAGTASPCQVDFLPSLSESLDYLMDIFEVKTTE
ncbi:Aste57867_23005 [Aphanomyces stellatus]|uniref:Aste57867_23005 protein n=1 Tax=Aphanomyces stellatus TaxID=120398 RepID=A0A485LLQ0_9STRA|nr:hypothetical protein As57867_022934 [Aphanomyces stellatus]VFT99653.1 Aste57867_23005 [Aphanomyces stellatus]